MLLHFDAKMIIVAALFALLVGVKLLAGSKPWDAPVRRPRRFGHRGKLGPLRSPAAAASAQRSSPPEPAPDPEREFFGDP